MTEARISLGRVVLFGSGETSASGRAIHDRLMRELPPPVVVAILETPAGFQPNSEHVAREVGDFMEARLRNYRPEVRVIPARKKGTPLSPDDPCLLEPLLDAAEFIWTPAAASWDRDAWSYSGSSCPPRQWSWESMSTPRLSSISSRARDWLLGREVSLSPPRVWRRCTRLANPLLSLSWAPIGLRILCLLPACRPGPKRKSLLQHYRRR